MIKDEKQYENKYDWPKIGNNRLIQYLDNSLASSKLAQTYIFAGPENLGKNTVALAFARNLLLSDGHEAAAFSSVNSDLHILKREEGKKNISIEAVRNFIKMLSLSSFLNSYKIGIIKEAETLSSEAANALLKTLEEPREKVIIILLTSSIESLPETIASRAQILYFHPLPSEEVFDYLTAELGLKRSEAVELAALSAGRPLLAAQFVENNDLYAKHLEIAKTFFDFFNQDMNDRIKGLNELISNSDSPLNADSAAMILEIWQRAARDLMLSAANCQDLIQHVALKEKADIALDNYHRNASYFLGVLQLLEVIKKYINANVSPLLALEQVVYNI